MTDQAVAIAPNVDFLDAHPAPVDSHREILDGLRRDPKVLDPKWFYDHRGAELFSEITRLPEYYPTRTEVGILTDNRAEIAARCEAGCVLIEPGSGSAEKVRLLLDELRPVAYVPLDISARQLEDEAVQLGREYPWLQVTAVCTDFRTGWSYLQDLPPGKRVVFYPGSTLGNLEPDNAVAFLDHVRRVIGDDGGMLIGVDTHKDEKILHAAYNDAQGVTARFNLNALLHLNKLLDANFDPELFEHRAHYDTEKQRIEMHLASNDAQVVRCNGESISFAAGETIHTENSYKYSIEGFTELAARAGLVIEQSWYDADRLFGVHYLGVG